MGRPVAKVDKTAERPVLSVDENDLVSEWKRQAELYHEWAVAAAAARAEEDQAKAQMELVEAETRVEAMENPSAFGLTKATVDSVNAAVIMDAGFKKAQARYLSCKEERATLEAMVAALDHKKRALESLVQLRVADYYAEPSVPSRMKREEETQRRERVARKTQE